MAQPRGPTSTAARDSMQAARPVSSFYGGGGGGPSSYHQNRDSYISTGNRSSMFYNGADYPSYSPTGARPNANGLQRNSYYSQVSQMQDEYAPYDPYDQHPSPSAQTPDIYGDFNNVAPKVANRMSSYDKASTANDTQTSLLEKGNRMSMAGGELVPTPELGKDWDADEGRRNKVITEKPQSGSGLYKGWLRSAKKAMQWKYFIFIVFGFLCCLAALLFFVIPRVPSLELSVDAPLSSNNRNITFTRVPALFNWNAQLNVAIDGRSNWIPFHFTAFTVSLYDLNTSKKVAEGGLAEGRRNFPGRKMTPTAVDLRFFYRGNNESDTTWQDFYNACAHRYNGVERPGLDFTVEVKMGVRGLIGEKTTGTTVTGFACPIELPADNA